MSPDRYRGRGEEEGGRGVYISRSFRRSIALFAAAFFLCGFLHVLFHAVPFTTCFTQLYCGCLCALWALTIQKRVTDPSLRTTLLLAAAAETLLLLLQICRYAVFWGNAAAARFLWSAYYVPMLALPLLCFHAAISIRRPREERLPWVWAAAAAVSGVIVLGFLTNGVHQLAFRFPPDMTRDEDVVYGPLFYLFYIWFFLLILFAFLTALQKCRRAPSREYWLLPMVPMAVLTLWLILNAFHVEPKYHGIEIWNIGNIFGFCMIGFLEICIQIGLIPANQEYENLFRTMNQPAVILDKDGTLRIRTAAAEYPFPERKDRRSMSHPIRGGCIQWTEDLSHLQRLNEELKEATAQTKARNAHLAAENQVKAEMAELETRERLYDMILRLLKPTLDRIEELLSGPEDALRAALPEIAVLSAYVKRRSNMELLSASGSLPVEELGLAVRESMEYLRLCGVETAVSATGTGKLPAAVIIAAYESVETALENCLDTLSALAAVIRVEEERLILRLLLKTERFSWLPDPGEFLDRGVRAETNVSRDGPDVIVSITFAGGGEGA